MTNEEIEILDLTEDSENQDDVVGMSTDGNVFSSITEMWDEKVGTPEKSTEWYHGANDYWKKIDSTVDGMLGGYGTLTKTDVRGSNSFLRTLKKRGQIKSFSLALDCGAGIGRVTRELLLPLFEKVALVEQCEKFCRAAKQSLPASRIQGIYCSGLQDYTPEESVYDCIWVQWVAIYLHDEDFIGFLQRCKEGINKNGVIVLKENVMRGPEFCVDMSDNSITRSEEHYESLFQEAGLSIVLKEKQTAFPDELFPVIMWALK